MSATAYEATGRINSTATFIPAAAATTDTDDESRDLEAVPFVKLPLTPQPLLMILKGKTTDVA